MPTASRDDARGAQPAAKAVPNPKTRPAGPNGSGEATPVQKNAAPVLKQPGEARGKKESMTAFVESCVETAVGSAVAVERGSRHRPRARKLVKLLKDRKNVLVTTHQYPDPDALASSYALAKLLRAKLPGAQVTMSVKGPVGGGYNAAFTQLSEFKPTPWDDKTLSNYDAILLLDVQPGFKFSPLPPGVTATAVIDHHRTRGRRPKCRFCDIRTDVGATSSIIFSYYMEMEQDIDPDLAATLLFAIETDLAGAVGTPGELDNMALSSLTLLADTRKLYKMRYVQLPQSVYVAYAEGLNNAVIYDNVAVTHLNSMIQSPETPAVIADFLLRYDPVQWVLVTAVNGTTMGMSLRTSSGKASAADAMRRLLRQIGEGGGHRTKAGGSIQMETGSDAEVDRWRTQVRKRLLRGLGVNAARGQRLVPKVAEKKP